MCVCSGGGGMCMYASVCKCGGRGGKEGYVMDY